LSKQNWKKVLIYFEKEENLKIPENIKLVSFDELLKDEVI
jgi:hypothetical protein